MNNDLITWEQEPAQPAETWADIVGVTDENETYAVHRAGLEAERERIAAENELHSLSDAELMKRWQKAAKELEATTLAERQIDAVHRFIKATPELVLNDKNQKRIDAYLKAAKLDASEPSHFDQAYRTLSARRLLEIDEAKRVRVPFARYTEADLESMPLAQLEELARGTR